MRQRSTPIWRYTWKLGDETSLVWVTTLDKAFHVPNASISIRDCEGRQLWSGKTDKTGMAWVRQPLRQAAAIRVRAQQCRFLVRLLGLGTMASKAGVSTGTDWRGPNAFHDFRPQPAARRRYRYMKHLARKRTSAGFAAADNLLNQLLIRHYGSGQEFTQPLKWLGGAPNRAGKCPVPRWRIRRSWCGSDKTNPQQWYSGSFRVGEFRVPLMRGVNGVAENPAAERATEVPVDVQVNHLSGGGGRNALVVLPVLRSKLVHFQRVFRLPVRHRRRERRDMKKGGLKSTGTQVEGGIRSMCRAKPSRRTRSRCRSSVSISTPRARRTLRCAILPQPPSPRELINELEYADPNV